VCKILQSAYKFFGSRTSGVGVGHGEEREEVADQDRPEHRGVENAGLRGVGIYRGTSLIRNSLLP
jgi:hypothetical protein